LLCCVYRSPSDYQFFNNITVECEDALLGHYQWLLFFGDFNADPTVIPSRPNF